MHPRSDRSVNETMSREQAAVVLMMTGGRISWEPVEMPVGPQPLPDWVRGVHVDMMLQYGGNAPRVKVKVNRSIHDWPGKVFHKDGSRYLAESGDGRADCHYHGGTIGMDKVRRFRTEDGELHSEYPGVPGRERIKGEWVDVERLCTTQQDGYAGRHYPIQLDDGRELILRGPWHGGPPPGYVDVIIVDTSWAWFNRWRANRPWHEAGGTFGTYLSEDLFLRIIARFAPHLRVGRVDIGSGPMLEPYLEEWGEPKQFWQQRFLKPAGYPKHGGKAA